jgi:hypothetical protein
VQERDRCPTQVHVEVQTIQHEHGAPSFGGGASFIEELASGRPATDALNHSAADRSLVALLALGTATSAAFATITMRQCFYVAHRREANHLLCAHCCRLSRTHGRQAPSLARGPRKSLALRRRSWEWPERGHRNSRARRHADPHYLRKRPNRCAGAVALRGTQWPYYCHGNS